MQRFFSPSSSSFLRKKDTNYYCLVVFLILWKWKTLSQSEFSGERHEVNHTAHCVLEAENGHLPYESQLNESW